MDTKFKIKAGEQNLLTELESLITEISNIVVVQGVGPNIGNLLAIKSNLKTLLKL
jgi:carbamate kinase